MYIGLTLRHVGSSQIVAELAQSLAKTNNEVAIFIEEYRQPMLALPAPVYSIGHTRGFSSAIITTTPFACELAHLQCGGPVCYFCYYPVRYTPPDNTIVIVRSDSYKNLVGDRYNGVLATMDVDRLAELIQEHRHGSEETRSTGHSARRRASK